MSSEPSKDLDDDCCKDVPDLTDLAEEIGEVLAEGRRCPEVLESLAGELTAACERIRCVRGKADTAREKADQMRRGIEEWKSCLETLDAPCGETGPPGAPKPPKPPDPDPPDPIVLIGASRGPILPPAKLAELAEEVKATLEDERRNPLDPEALDVELATTSAGAETARAEVDKAHEKIDRLRGTLKERREASAQYQGHALALSLLGTYLVKACGGEIRQLPEIDVDEAVAAQGGHAWRVIAAYEDWLGEREVSVLRLLGLFDRPAEPEALAVLRAAPAMANLNDGLVDLDERAWNVVLSNLREGGLLVRGDGGKLDAHPLVRAYFGHQLEHLLNAAGFRLRALGRLTEAVQPMEASGPFFEIS